jgi:Uri superfamily endonuclease
VTALPTVYTSGVSPVTTYDPIFPAVSDPTYKTTTCTTVPAIGLNSTWVNPHAAYVINGHPWVGLFFNALWINSYNDLSSQGPANQSWTKYTTPISGVGPYVLQLLADNCSWVYVDNQLVGVQPFDWNDRNTKYSLTLAGAHTLTFIIFDGGGLAGGKFRLETYDSYIANHGDPSLVSAPPTLTPTATTVSFGPGPFLYTGSAYTATATVSNGATATIVYSGDCVSAGGTCTATAAYAGDAIYAGSSATKSITLASTTPTTTTVTFATGPFVYTGSAFTATASVTPAGSATIVYTGDCTNAGSTCTATATYAGDANHLGSSATANITIAKAPGITSVSFGYGPFVYRGSPFTATASVSPAAAGTATVSYSGNCANAGNTCTATATSAGNANFLPSSASASITIDKAPTSTSVTFGAGPFVYTGSAFTATASVSPAAAGSATVAYSGDCTNAGNSCTATATFAGNVNFLSSSASTSIVIKLPVATSSGQCKQGGWQFVTDDLGNLFKNQGDCVSYVATKGKNKGDGAP